MIGTRGRKPTMDYVDGELVEIRKVIKTGNSMSVTLPRQWIAAVQGKGELEGVTLVYNAHVLTIRPYYGKNGEVSDDSDTGLGKDFLPSDS